ncbi:hypothetical protein P8452_26736 [Trifolium repens]|nr:hypothetical protein P8452_26731 [Trifolium repens]WJX39161.1 hypothetical protein P8452_26736 [Trifolium repens]
MSRAVKWRRRDSPLPPRPVTGGDGESPTTSPSLRRFSIFGETQHSSNVHGLYDLLSELETTKIKNSQQIDHLSL